MTLNDTSQGARRVMPYGGTGHQGQKRSAFTLIEMLVVIAVVGILAAIIVNLSTNSIEKKVTSRAQMLLEDLELAIEGYKDEKGFYPPSHPTDPTRPPLYYSLKGSVAAPDNSVFTTLAGETLTSAEIQAAFVMDGFVNSAKDRGQVADFFPKLQLSYIQEENGVKYIGMPYKGPEGEFNPVRYDASSNSRQNQRSYDLWVEVVIGSKTNIIKNWE